MNLLSAQKVMVFGLGESGLAICRWLLRYGITPVVVDTRSEPPLKAKLLSVWPALSVHCGTLSPALLDGVDLLLISPGIDPRQGFARLAVERGVSIAGELELFLYALEQENLRQHCRVVGITGTNGKTTTTALLTVMINATETTALAAGNISPAMLDALCDRLEAKAPMPDVWVLELSSFQLETLNTARLEIGIILNITEDHLDRYDSMAEYVAAKLKLLLASDQQVLSGDDAILQKQLAAFPQAGFIGGQNASYQLRRQNGAYVLELKGGERLAADSLRLHGLQNASNFLFAIACCDLLGLPRHLVIKAAQNFEGLPHRVRQIARRKDGVCFVDDSKGTNVGASIAAIEGSLAPIVMILGGDGKGQDFKPLAVAARGRVKAAVLIGRDANEISRCLAEQKIHTEKFPDLAKAVVAANALAEAGDVVLLSPACSSLDMFRNYIHRAEEFSRAVLQLAEVDPL